MLESDKNDLKFATIVGACILAGIAVILMFIVTAMWGFGTYSRWNAVQAANNSAHTARIDAANQTQVNQLLISANAQQVQIHKQQADIRLADAVGIRAAQDEISKTLTPLYVQFEMVDALKEMALSGKNNTLEIIPGGANGIPLVGNVIPGSSQTAVTTP